MFVIVFTDVHEGWKHFSVLCVQLIQVLLPKISCIIFLIYFKQSQGHRKDIFKVGWGGGGRFKWDFTKGFLIVMMISSLTCHMGNV